MTAIVDEKHDTVSCPHCDGKLKVPIRRGIATAALDSGPDLDEIKSKLSALSDKIEAPRIEKEVIYPSFMPGEYCPDGNCALGGVHKNKNYKRKPAKACRNCSQIAPKQAGRCAWCGQDDFEPLDEDNLAKLGIKMPPDDEENQHHGHDHDE